ncbi:hypothetical protein [Vibrio splendidus]|jgi:hypothetical protein|uniref:hypothetical protein n=1 Tax=Vibrio splendidus TaxID=29497 RepID=UPI00031127D8|nr:hypothetical protein [Vibrio splendidus]MDP2592398.1 hypothetical protein [Vibrio splendidus]OEE56256.1 hypothetical protein A146_03705 [Vibrio splendidus FF-500]PTP69842.1 hypothetical protein CWO00_22445 [Vibrio splendidus]SBS65454.1 hypothetical protein VHE8714_02765 [Vibrio splendidus]
MSFADMMNDTVDLIKADGTKKVEGIKASVQDKMTFIERSDILIESGDLLQRKASNGSVSNYKVLDPGFHEAFGSISAHYQIKHQNLSIQEAEKMVQSITYNFGSISTEQMQVGNNNTQNVTINMHQLVEKIAKSNDDDAKSKLKALLENSTVASVVGAGVSSLISLI